MQLEQLVTQPDLFISEETPLTDVAGRFVHGGATVVGVTRDGKAIGTITVEDLVNRAISRGKDLSKFQAKHVMERRPFIIDWPSDDSDLIDAAILMRREKVGNAIVTKEGIPCGFLSRGALNLLDLSM